MYIIKRTVIYPTGKVNTGFVISDKLFLELSSDVEKAKRYKTKEEAKRVVKFYKRSKNEHFKIIKIKKGS